MTPDDELVQKLSEKWGYCVWNANGELPAVEKVKLAVREAIEETRKREWTPISDALPKMWEEVLVSHNYHSDRSEEIGFLCEDGNWQMVRTGHNDEPIIVSTELVTHWMPIPESPLSDPTPAAGNADDTALRMPPEKNTNPTV